MDAGNLIIHFLMHKIEGLLIAGKREHRKRFATNSNPTTRASETVFIKKTATACETTY